MKRPALGAFATGGATERSALQAHQQAHQTTLDERIAEVEGKGKRERRGGRKALFEEKVRLAVFLPPDAATKLKAAAATRNTTISALVAEFARGL